MKSNVLLLTLTLVLVMTASSLALDWDLNMDVPYDLGGREIRLEHGGARPEDDGEVNLRAQAIAANYNATLEWVPRTVANVETWTAGIVAGDPLSHIMRPGRTDYYEGLAAGLFAPLDETLKEIEFWENTAPRFLPENYKFGGVTYAIPYRYFVRGTVILWNKDLFEREGLPNLYDIYDAGDWTFDKLMEIVDMAGRDTTGDGEIDRLALALRGEERLLWANEAQPYAIEDGRAVATFDRPEFIAAQEFMLELYRHEATARIDRFDMLDAFANSDIAMVTGNMSYKARLMGNGIDWSGQERRVELMEDDYGLLPLPTGPHSDVWVNYDSMPFITFPVIEDDLNAVVDMASWLTRSSRKYYDVDAEEERLYNSVADYLRDEESLEIFDHLWNTCRVMSQLRLPGRPELMARYIAEGSAEYATIAEGVDSLLPEGQAFLDDFFNQ